MVIHLWCGIVKGGGKEPFPVRSRVFRFKKRCPAEAVEGRIRGSGVRVDAVGGHWLQKSRKVLHHRGGGKALVLFAGNFQRHAAARRHFHLGGAGRGVVDIPGEGGCCHGKQGGKQCQRGGNQTAPELFGLIHLPCSFLVSTWLPLWGSCQRQLTEGVSLLTA